MPKGNPWSYDMAKNKIEALGYTLLSPEYYGSSSKIIITDKFGYKYFTTWNLLQNGRFPEIVNKFNPYSIENIQVFLNLQNSEINLISKIFVNAKEKLELQCRCGNIFYKDWTSLCTRKQFLCPKCVKSKFSNLKKLNASDVFEKFKEYGLVVESNENYIANNAPIRCINSEGYKLRVSYSNLAHSRSHLIFSTKYNKDNYIYNVNNYFKINNINCEALYLNGDKQGDADVMVCRCFCGNTFITTLDSIKCGQIRCTYCSRTMSKIEFKTREWLDENKIEYFFQYRFDDCINPKSGRKLPFDFFLPKHNLCIEADGSQHHSPSIFSTTQDAQLEFENRQYLDNLKNIYCQEHNIHLLRIDYKKFRSNAYKIILSNKIL